MPKKDMLINYVPGEECRIAIVEDGRIEELYQERASAESHVGNIYKGRVLNVEPSIQAAFIDFGLDRNGFLHISDLHPRYFPGKDREEFERVGDKTPRRERPPIQKCLRRGQEILVQVLKEGIGTKGPTLTSYLSIPGRLIVMMPHMERMGVSRKVDDDDARREMRTLLNELKPPDGFGFIIRTAGIGRTKTELKRDLAYLVRLWKSIEARMKQTGRVGELYTESDLVIRTLRDVFTSDIERVIVDDPTAAKRAFDFLSIVSPRSGSKVLLYNDPVPLFHRFDIERQIDHINAREVPLPSGGSLVIDSTEALVAIDVNSGKSRDARDAETNAYKTNIEAVDEIARQLRLRDLGGVVVLDLIDMRSDKHRKDIEQRFRNLLKKDRARTRIGPISQFGLLEMTRQRMRPSLKKSIYAECSACTGSGHVKSAESVVLDVMRRLALVLNRNNVARVELTISPDAAFHVLNRKRSQLVKLEEQYGKPVMVRVNGAGPIDYVQMSAFDGRGGAVETDTISASADPKLDPTTAFVEVTSDGLPPEFDDELAESTEDEAWQESADEEEVTPAKAPASVASAGDDDASEPKAKAPTDKEGEEGGKRRRRRRRGRRGRGGKTGESTGETGEPQAAEQTADAADASDADTDTHAGVTAPPAPETSSPSQAESDADSDNNGKDAGTEEGSAKRRRRRRRRRRGGSGNATNGNGADAGDEAASDAPSPDAGRNASPPAPTVSRGYANRTVAASNSAAETSTPPESKDPAPES